MPANSCVGIPQHPAQDSANASKSPIQSACRAPWKSEGRDGLRSLSVTQNLLLRGVTALQPINEQSYYTLCKRKYT